MALIEKLTVCVVDCARIGRALPAMRRIVKAIHREPVRIIVGSFRYCRD
jgi:hypothetical protein